jgi:hypothetical protein
MTRQAAGKDQAQARLRSGIPGRYFFPAARPLSLHPEHRRPESAGGNWSGQREHRGVRRHRTGVACAKDPRSQARTAPAGAPSPGVSTSHFAPAVPGCRVTRRAGRLAACSTTGAGRLVQPAAQCQSGWLAVQRKCPERRSDDGQAILEGRPDGRKTLPDLVFCVELWGFEPQTSCMPCTASKSGHVDLSRIPGGQANGTV